MKRIKGANLSQHLDGNITIELASSVDMHTFKEDAEDISQANIQIFINNKFQTNSNPPRSHAFSTAKLPLQNEETVLCIHPKVICIDDDPFNILILSGMLQQLGVDLIDKSFDPVQALQTIEQNFESTFQCNFYTPGRDAICSNHSPYKLIIVDNQMPQMSGMELAQIVRSKQAKGELSPYSRLMLLTGSDKLLTDS